jgi:hypothetical protein
LGDAVTFATAVLAATLYALFARPFGDYHYWFTWSRTAFTVGIVLYFLVAGLGAGALGFLAGLVSKASPTSWPAVNGVLFGLVGALAIRAELGAPRSRKSPTEGVSQQFAPAVTLLNVGTVWTFDMVDRLVVRAIERWLKSLTDQQLCAVALEAAQHVSQLVDVPDPAKVATLAGLTTPMEELRAKADESGRDEPRVRLRGFSLTLFKQYRWSRPLLST